MKLLKELESIQVISKTGKERKRRQGLFLCPKCSKEVQKPLDNGKKNETCGSKDCKDNHSYGHGYSNSAIYTCWNNIRLRCDRPTHKSYKYYGAKGITYPKEWNTFEGFFNDMGFTYQEGLTIDRIKKEKNYSKENCQWISMEENRVKDRIKTIAKYTLEGEFIKSYPSAADAVRAGEAKVSTSITRVARGDRKQYKGFLWKYI